MTETSVPDSSPVDLMTGEVVVRGRILPASNLTAYGEVVSESGTIACVYKPIAGERPLWDFPDGSLAGREVAAYVVSEALGWDIVPPTVLRDGPAGPGMVQQFVEVDPGQDPVDLLPAGSPTPGMLRVLEAYDGEDRPVVLVHEDSDTLRRMAVFDIVVNNADRKGGHVLAMPDGHRYGVDHGVCFHVENKLRTVLWGWLGQPLRAEDREALTALRDRLDRAGDEVRQALGALLAPDEVHAVAERCTRLLRADAMPAPSGGWPSIPWPAF